MSVLLNTIEISTTTKRKYDVKNDLNLKPTKWEIFDTKSYEYKCIQLFRFEIILSDWSTFIAVWVSSRFSVDKMNNCFPDASSDVVTGKCSSWTFSCRLDICVYVQASGAFPDGLQDYLGAQIFCGIAHTRRVSPPCGCSCVDLCLFSGQTFWDRNRIWMRGANGFDGDCKGHSWRKRTLDIGHICRVLRPCVCTCGGIIFFFLCRYCHKRNI